MVQDNNIIRKAMAALQSRLPSGWQVELGYPVGPGADAHFLVQAPDGRAAQVLVQTARSLEPRGAVELRSRFEDAALADAVVVVAPFLSPAVRERLGERGFGFIDLTGNIRIALSEPGLLIDVAGADVNPDRQARTSRSLRGGKAGRIVRALVDAKQPPGVRELAELTGTNAGYVSRVMAVLDRQALIEREGRGRIVSVDWPRLLTRWAEEAPLASRGRHISCLEPRGIATLTTKLGQLDSRYAVSGSLAVADLAPVAPARLAIVYVEDAEEAMAQLGLRATDRGTNVLVIEPEDEGVFEGCRMVDGLRCVAPSQAAVDLLGSPGRGPAEAEALIEWMREHEEAWRG